MHFVAQADDSKPKLIPATALCAVSLLDKGPAIRHHWPQLFAALSRYDPAFDYCGNGAQTLFLSITRSIFHGRQYWSLPGRITVMTLVDQKLEQLLFASYLIAVLSLRTLPVSGPGIQFVGLGGDKWMHGALFSGLSFFLGWNLSSYSNGEFSLSLFP